VLVRSALGKAVLAASTPALRREMLNLTASAVAEDGELAKDRRFVDETEKGRLRIVSGRVLGHAIPINS
jgi:hypothetical protein